MNTGVLSAISRIDADGSIEVSLRYKKEDVDYTFPLLHLPSVVWQDFICMLTRGQDHGNLLLSLEGAEEVSRAIENTRKAASSG